MTGSLSVMCFCVPVGLFTVVFNQVAHQNYMTQVTVRRVRLVAVLATVLVTGMVAAVAFWAVFLHRLIAEQCIEEQFWNPLQVTIV